MKIKIWNYRNIPLDSPIEIEITNRITFILGMNNIGKSNLLRFFVDFRQLLKNSPDAPSNFNSQLGIQFDRILFRNSSNPFIKFEINEGGSLITYTINVLEEGNLHTNNIHVQTQFSNTEGDKNDDVGGNFKLAIKKFIDTLYIPAERNNILNARGSANDIEIGETFIQNWDNWSTGEDILKRQKIRILIEEIKEIFNLKNFDISLNNSRNNLLINTNGDQFLITDMGNGLAHFIIVLGNILIKNPGYVLIDEPEINLHPKLQEKFVIAIASKVKYGVLATSHSVGLARSVADKIYSYTSINNRPKLVEYGKHYTPTISQSISEMGYSQFVDIGGNNILLVEGRTDIKSFREILRKYGLDNKFIILSLGGGAFVVEDASKIADELNEIKRLNPKSVYVIFDSERTSQNEPLKKKFEKFKKICEEQGFQVFPTDRHSTENYISQSAIDKVIGSSVTSLNPYEDFNENPKWDKNLNWRLLSEMKKEDFKDTGLHEFITKTMKK